MNRYLPPFRVTSPATGTPHTVHPITARTCLTERATFLVLDDCELAAPAEAVST